MAIETVTAEEFRKRFQQAPSALPKKRRKKSKGTPEGAVKRQCLAWLQAHRVLHWNNYNGAVYDPVKQCYRKHTGRKGVSDIIGSFRGRFFAVETKAPNGVLTVEEVAFLADVAADGGIAITAWCLEDMVRVFRDMGVGG